MRKRYSLVNVEFTSQEVEVCLDEVFNDLSNEELAEWVEYKLLNANKGDTMRFFCGMLGLNMHSTKEEIINKIKEIL